MLHLHLRTLLFIRQFDHCHCIKEILYRLQQIIPLSICSLNLSKLIWQTSRQCSIHLRITFTNFVSKHEPKRMCLKREKGILVAGDFLTPKQDKDNLDYFEWNTSKANPIVEIFKEQILPPIFTPLACDEW